MEAQAAGRVHRLGQTKEVFIRRIAFRDSVESMVVAVQSAVKTGNLNKFEWVRIHNLLVRQPVMTDEVKNILRAHGLHQPHVATVPKPTISGDKWSLNPETCGKCGRACKLEECAPPVAATSSSNGSSAAQGSAPDGNDDLASANVGSSSAGGSAV
jgi:hypothetical protein